MPRSSPGYDYGPPVGQVGSGLENAQDNSGAVNIIEPGDKPHTPPADAALVQEPGGATNPNAVAPLTIETLSTDGLTVTVRATGPGAYNGCEVLWGDGSAPEYPGPGGTSGSATLSHTYAAGGEYEVSVDPLGDLFPPTLHTVTVTDPSPPPDPEE